VRNLAVRHPGVLVQIDDGRLGIAAELAPGRARGIAGLQGVTAADLLAALLAMAAVDLELPHDGLARDLGLELLVEAVLDDFALAMRARLRQRSVEGFVDPFVPLRVVCPKRSHLRSSKWCSLRGFIVSVR